MDYAMIDVETTNIEDGKIPETKFWGYADSNRYEYFATTKALSKFLRKSEPKILLHHTNFDVIQLLVDGENIQIQKSHNNKLIRCRLHDHYLQNSFAIFPLKMEKLFKAFGYEKTPLENLEKRNCEDCVQGLE